MQTSLALKTVDRLPFTDLLTQVLDYENEEFTERLKDKLSLTDVDARVLFTDMKKFLFMCGTRHGIWSPTAQIDAAWHEFILYTKDYAAFCDKMFGRFLHHVPRSYFGGGTKGRTWATRNVAEGMFGCLSKNWDIPDSMRPQANGMALAHAEAADTGPCDSCGCASSCLGD